MKGGRLAILVGLMCVLLGQSATIEAQRYRRGRNRYFEPMERDIFPGHSFTFCRIRYSSGWGDDGGWGRRGGRWSTDFPESDENFSLRLSELTTLNVNRTDDGRFQHVIVQLDEEEVFKYPFAYMLEVGNMALSVEEQEGLRSYLLRGGFLMVDDFWGDDAWENWVFEIEQVFPPEEYPMVDIPLDHEIFNIVFHVSEVPQVPSVNHYYYWEETGISYEDRFRYSRYGPEAHCRGIFDKDGRLMVVVMHNTDLGDGWEREGENYGYFKEFSAKRAYPMGINIVVYAMTH